MVHELVHQVVIRVATLLQQISVAEQLQSVVVEVDRTA